MATYVVKDLYDSSGRCRIIPESWFLYAIFCEVPGHRAMVKIGRAKNVYQRVTALSTGMCHPIHVVLFVEVGNQSEACEVERLSHRALAPFNTRGEWFDLDLSDTEHKLAFHSAVKDSFKHVTGRAMAWRRIVPEQLAAYSSLRTRKARKHKRVA